MKKIFTVSLAVIGGVIGFILGMTITFAMNINSSLVLIALGIVFAVIGGVGLMRMAPHLEGLEATVQKPLMILCAIIAVILLLFLWLTLVTLKAHYQIS